MNFYMLLFLMKGPSEHMHLNNRKNFYIWIFRDTGKKIWINYCYYWDIWILFLLCARKGCVGVNANALTILRSSLTTSRNSEGVTFGKSKPQVETVRELLYGKSKPTTISIWKCLKKTFISCFLILWQTCESWIIK